MITDNSHIDQLLRSALQEDMGSEDLTSRVIPRNLSVRAGAVFKSPGCLCGIQIAEQIFRLIDQNLRFLPAAKDGENIEEGRTVFYVEGCCRSILAAERTALNFMSHLSGVATLTRRFVDRVKDTRAAIYDTRKTTPLLRTLERHAVHIGGARNHRSGLYDGVLLKENHLLAMRTRKIEDLAKTFQGAALKRVSVGVEVRSLTEAEAALRCGFDYILLDHFSVEDTKRAVDLRKRLGTKIPLEVSGNIGLENVRDYALAGVERISVGALTHSAPPCDISLHFELTTSLKPTGDQPQAIHALVRDLRSRKKHNTLLGVTGSGKTFTIAHVIQATQKPTLVISHNKTLVAQLYSEFKDLFPRNAVEYFVSYYDYYQPEAYMPQTDTYIEKDSSINDDIDRLRLRATSSLLSRNDCIIVSSVSCIYGLGSPEDYSKLLVFIKRGQTLDREDLLRQLVEIRYERNDVDFKRGTFRVKGDLVDVFLAYEETAVRVSLDFDKVRSVQKIHPVTSEVLQELEVIAVYPAKHFVTTQERIDQSLVTIEAELDQRLEELRGQHKLVELQRLEQRTRYDLEMLRAMGYCSGIENYSRHLADRSPGSRPYCLLDYFPKDYLVVIDESHVTVPQIRGMFNGDHARKQTLVDFGFRLPSALDNRPLRIDEFESLVPEVIYVSATPAAYEKEHSGKAIEQIIRPTGLLDPPIEVRPTKGQIDDLIEEVQRRAKISERVLVTTLTKRMSEELTQYLKEMGLRVKYLHSDIGAIERVEILRDLRLKRFDCLVGINLLREGLDLPEVSLVAILDADNEGFLRSFTSLIQTSGRAARHIHGQVIFYADRLTDSIRAVIEVTRRRRKIQEDFNRHHGITPQGIQKKIMEGIEAIKKVRDIVQETTGLDDAAFDKHAVISELEEEMEMAARNLQFERAIVIRNQIRKLQKYEAKA